MGQREIREINSYGRLGLWGFHEVVTLKVFLDGSEVSVRMCMEQRAYTGFLFLCQVCMLRL